MSDTILDSVNEGKTTYHSLTFFDKEGQSITPEELRYRIINGSGNDIVPWTDILPNTTTIEVSSLVNTIGSNGSYRILTVEATHGGGRKITEELSYIINNLMGYP